MYTTSIPKIYRTLRSAAGLMPRARLIRTNAPGQAEHCSSGKTWVVVKPIWRDLDENVVDLCDVTQTTGVWLQKISSAKRMSTGGVPHHKGLNAVVIDADHTTLSSARGR